MRRITRKNKRNLHFFIAMNHVKTFLSDMISTQERDSVSVPVTPDITAKAALIAARSPGNRNTISVIQDWIIEKAAEFPLPEDYQQEGARP